MNIFFETLKEQKKIRQLFLLLILLVALPFTLLLAQQRQDIRERAQVVTCQDDLDCGNQTYCQGNQTWEAWGGYCDELGGTCVYNFRQVSGNPLNCGGGGGNLYCGATGQQCCSSGQQCANTSDSCVGGICTNQSTGTSTIDIQGYKVLMPGNNTNPGSTIASVGVRLVNASGTVVGSVNTANPYFFNDAVRSNVARVELVNPPTNAYTIGYTACFGTNTNTLNACHANRLFTQGTSYLIPSGAIANDTIDLWWHFTAGGSGTLTISGNVFIDSNNNQNKDTDELNYTNGTTVTLSGSVFTSPQTATTNSSGNYTFNNLAPGSYTVNLTVPSGFTLTTQPNPRAINQSSNTVNFGINPGGIGGNCSTAGQTNPYGTCSNNSCIAQQGCGFSTCNIGTACGGGGGTTCPAGQSDPHSVCSGTGICTLVAGCGANTCSPGLSCGVSTVTPTPGGGGGNCVQGAACVASIAGSCGIGVCIPSAYSQPPYPGTCTCPGGQSPTATPVPTNTPVPTSTPVPTLTGQPTATPIPTAPPGSTPNQYKIKNVNAPSDCTESALSTESFTSFTFPAGQNFIFRGNWPLIDAVAGTKTVCAQLFDATGAKVTDPFSGQITLTSGPTATPTVTGTQPTTGATVIPGGTNVFLSVNLEGFSPTAIPARGTEPVQVSLKSASEAILGPFDGTLTYSASHRRFEGAVNLAGVPAGIYDILVKPVSYLAQRFNGVTIATGVSTSVPTPNPFLACDPNNSNGVEILDINQVYSDIRVGRIDSFVDYTREGLVDIFDHNFCVANFLKQGASLP